MAKYRHSGAVSIFSVIFATLLLTVLTVGFIRLMISAQYRATNSDLSQSAYDSALAGVEDAKRVIRACNDGSALACDALSASQDCRVINKSHIAGSNDSDEVVIRTESSTGEQFDQAYTCVKIDMNTPDYVYEASLDQSHIIPLRSQQEIKTVTVEWFNRTDAGDAPAATAPPSRTAVADVDSGWLPALASWSGGSATVPPVIRAQLITPGGMISPDSLDSSEASRTVMVRPQSMSSGATNFDISLNQQRATDGGQYRNSLVLTPCSRNFSNNGHSCRVTFQLSDTIPAGSGTEAVLRLNTIYRGANIRVSMQAEDGTVSYFNGVQPKVDSTGRANNLFRRVEARLSLSESFSHPSFAVDVASPVCKDFAVSDTQVVAGSCKP